MRFDRTVCALLEKSLFSLTVPTGGGKNLALLEDGIKSHVSANMCAADRTEVMALIRRY